MDQQKMGRANQYLEIAIRKEAEGNESMCNRALDAAVRLEKEALGLA